jgi:hypothetical protein
MKLSFVIKTDYKSLCHLQDQSMSTKMQRKAKTKALFVPASQLAFPAEKAEKLEVETNGKFFNWLLKR